jgi:hypothetical protein
MRNENPILCELGNEMFISLAAQVSSRNALSAATQIQLPHITSNCEDPTVTCTTGTICSHGREKLLASLSNIK